MQQEVGKESLLTAIAQQLQWLSETCQEYIDLNMYALLYMQYDIALFCIC